MNLITWKGCFKRYAAIGGGSSNLPSSNSSGHLKGKCTIVPGSRISSRAFNVPRRTAICVSLSPAGPTFCPKGCSIAATRGALTEAVRSGRFERQMVLMPAASISRCASPTDQLQIGQLGTNTRTSTCSSFSPWMIAGTLFSSISSGLGR